MQTVKPDYDYTAFHFGNPIQRWWKRNIAKTVWKWIPIEESVDRKILDVGGGSSPIIKAYHRGISVDWDEAKIEWNRANSSNHIEYLFGDARALEFIEDTFDYVLCIEVLEHIEDYEAAISEIARVLRPGGKAVIATPDFSTWQWRAVEWLYRLLRPDGYCTDHVSQLTRDRLVLQCIYHGLLEVEHLYVGGGDYVGLFLKTDCKPNLRL